MYACGVCVAGSELFRLLRLQKLEHQSSDTLNSVWVEMANLTATHLSQNATVGSDEASNS
jgi:hypothetical protein